jgi:transcriptional regulator with XRE-family HTH domain
MGRGRTRIQTLSPDGLRELRRRDLGDISRAELAKKLNIPEATLESYELGKRFPHGEELAKLADKYHDMGVDIARLINPGGIDANFLKLQGFSPPTGPDVKFAVSRLPTTGEYLLGRDIELGLLNDAWNNQRTNIVSIVAHGGGGKTQLVKLWRESMARDGFRGADRVFDWTFYSQGTLESSASADEFFIEALRHFGEDNTFFPRAWEKGERLAYRMRECRTLLILDGLEPLQNPPGMDEGRLTDPGLRALLVGLGELNPGLCVITTREPVKDIAHLPHPTAITLDLPPLSPMHGAELLRRYNVIGRPSELKKAAEEVEGYPLALTLLGTLLRDQFGGDVKLRDKVELMSGGNDISRHARRVMASYERWFLRRGDRAAVAILYLLGLFNRPATIDEFKTLCSPPAITDLTEPLVSLDSKGLRQAISRLQHARLLSTKLGPRRLLDAHPIVREHFAEQLAAKTKHAARSAHERLFRFLEGEAPPLPDRYEELGTLFDCTLHGCRAGMHATVLKEVFRPRIMRNEQFHALRRLGAYGRVLSSLVNFFDNGEWSGQLRELSGIDQVYVLTLVAMSLTVTRGFAAAETQSMFTRALNAARAPGVGSTREEFVALRGLWRNMEGAARLKEADRLTQQLVIIAKRSNDAVLRYEAYLASGSTKFFLGAFKKSHKALVYRIDQDEVRYQQIGVELDAVVGRRSYLAWVLWHLGHPDESVANCGRAIDRAERLEDLHSMALAQHYACRVAFNSRDVDALRHHVKKLVSLAENYAMPHWRAASRVFQGALLADDRCYDEAIGVIEDGIEQWRGTEARLGCSAFYGTAADVCLRARLVDRGLAAANKGLACVEEYGERYFESELYRLRGELLLLLKTKEAVDQAGESLSRAVAVAKSQHAASLELRALVSWARHVGPKRADARLIARLQDACEVICARRRTPDQKMAMKLIKVLR